MNTITTNFRTDVVNYDLLRRFAADYGVSINEYLNRLVTEDLRGRPLGIKIKKKIVKNTYDALLDFAGQSSAGKPMRLSAIDEEIYE
ncbi:hypothetical protein HZB69_04390 [Candidatus Amesbacteria bacterium]|nr:hypothetical protein [Candidatus Amesbacteria bacterium]